jgi:NDP-sugar pyrophosphorylase family protein
MTDDCMVCGCVGFVHRVVSMTDSVAGVVLAAGLGRRLRPLTLRRPKALCPVGNVPLVDLAMERLPPSVGAIAVNVHHHRDAMVAHLTGRAHCSVEDGEPLGTAGALGQLRGWLDGRAAVVVNSDTWCPGSLDAFVAGWDGARIRLLIAGDDELRPTSRIAGAVMPWSAIEPLDATPSGLYELSWAVAAASGEVEVVCHDGPFIDCGTPAQYLEANLLASGGDNVVGEGAEVEGRITRTVVWPGALVHRTETLIDAIRYDRTRTVYVRGR